MKPGDLVKYIGSSKDEIFFPETSVGVLISEVNEVGKVKVCFGKQISWVWTGYLSLILDKKQ